MKFKTTEDRIIDVSIHVLIALFAAICLYPLVYCVSMSFSSDNAILLREVVFLPVGFNLESYKMVLSESKFWTSLWNSVFYAAVGATWQVLWTFLLGYVTSRNQFVFKKFLDSFVLIPMFFGGGLIPTYLMMRGIGLYNNIGAIIIPGAISIWNSILVKSFIRSNIPNELMESALIDGANDLQVLTKIVVPLSTTIIAIIFMYAAMGIWNDYFQALIYLENQALHPLQLYLKSVMDTGAGELANSSGTANAVQLAIEKTRIRYVLVVVVAMPVALLYPVIQKYFVKGVTLGSIKG